MGGRLQGTEAAYLGLKAGYDVVLVDRRNGVPASGLATENHVFDICRDEERTRRLLMGSDAVLPACEDLDTLVWLSRKAVAWGVPLLFDLPAYSVSSSKIRSNRLFDQLGVDRPAPWPGCAFPLIIKPSGASGSEGVGLVHDEGELSAARAELERRGCEAVIEEFAPGPSLSLEVIAWRGLVQPLLCTELEFDRAFDCKRVLAPIGGPDADRLLARFDEIADRLALGVGLDGLMDIEVMVHDGVPKVLEIDARLPSQTPTVVLHSSGLNLVSLLAQTVLRDAIPEVDRTPYQGCCYQHVRVARGAAEVLGEHMMGAARPLRLIPGLFGADEVITDMPERCGDSDAWVATVITVAPSVSEARNKAHRALDRLVDEHGLSLCQEVDGSREPAGLEELQTTSGGGRDDEAY